MDFFDFGGDGLFSDGLSGSAGGEGFFGDFFGNFFGDFFGSGSEGIMGDVLGGMGRGMAEESFFARMFSFVGEGADFYWDYLIWRDISGNFGASADEFKRTWQGMGDAEKESYRSIKEAVKGHAFFREQLEKHVDKERIQELSEKFSALGYTMPDEELLKKSYRRLAPIYHPDKNPGDKIAEALFKDLESGNQAMKAGSAARTAYEDLLSTDPKKLEELYEHFSKNKIEDVHRAYDQASRKLLNAGPMGKAQSWVANLSGGQKAALAAGAIGLTAVAAYGIAKLIDKRDQDPVRRQADHNKKTYQSFAQQVQHNNVETTNTHIKR